MNHRDLAAAFEAVAGRPGGAKQYSHRRSTVVTAGGLCAGVAALSVLASPAFASPTFINHFDNTWTQYPGLLGAAESSAQNAERELDSLFSNNVTITLDFTATPYTSLAYSSVIYSLRQFPTTDSTQYDIFTEMANHSSAHPENVSLASYVSSWNYYVNCRFSCERDSVNNTETMRIAIAEQEALTGTTISLPAGLYDGTIGLNPTFNYVNGRSAVSSSQFDLTGIFLHEITHIMGRVGGASYQAFPLDVGRYNTLDPTSPYSDAQNPGFSVDGGATFIRDFDQYSDAADWDGQSISALDAFYGGGPIGLRSGDILTMNALGWDPNVGRTLQDGLTSGVPEPATWVVMLLGFGGLGAAIRSRRATKIA